MAFISQFYFQSAVDVNIDIVHLRVVINSFPSRYHSHKKQKDSPETRAEPVVFSL